MLFRSSIATALSLRPSLLICDEMTTALDVMNGEKVLDYVDYVRTTTGCAVLMITHHIHHTLHIQCLALATVMIVTILLLQTVMELY